MSDDWPLRTPRTACCRCSTGERQARRGASPSSSWGWEAVPPVQVLAEAGLVRVRVLAEAGPVVRVPSWGLPWPSGRAGRRRRRPPPRGRRRSSFHPCRRSPSRQLVFLGPVWGQRRPLGSRRCFRRRRRCFRRRRLQPWPRPWEPRWCRLRGPASEHRRPGSRCRRPPPRLCPCLQPAGPLCPPSPRPWWLRYRTRPVPQPPRVQPPRPCLRLACSPRVRTTLLVGRS